jgi:6,7-dimethyl-8-ribityllumazine synthase
MQNPEDGAAPPEPARLPEAVRVHEGTAAGTGLRVAVAVSRYNAAVTERLLEGAVEALAGAGVAAGDIVVFRVPGAFELPATARRLAESGFDAVVCLGAVIQGETRHFEYVCQAVTAGLGRLAYESRVPVTFGVLTTLNLDQALARAGGAAGHKGAEAALDALEIASLWHGLRGTGHSGAAGG